ncbi:MAG: HEAT repeat domain-containing protein [Planctomycetes bacterium]|nr:HEAT repeat domain-containing protein [Planctomycetota bacterium]
MSSKKATSRSPTARRLTRAEFARALRLGLGRARLDVRKYGIAGREDLLAAACRKDPRVIRELEDSPASWLVALARDGGTLDVVREAAIAAATQRTLADQHRSHAAGILAQLAMDGDTSARQALLRVWDSADHANSRVAQQLIWLLGAQGWRRVVDQLARRWPLSRDFDLGWIAYVGRKHVGTRRALAALPTRGTPNALAFAAVMRTAIVEEGRRRTRSEERAAAPRDSSLDRLEGLVRSRRRYPTGIRNWAEHATPDDREVAWRRLFSERDTSRLRKRLWAMSYDRNVALSPALMRLTRHRDPLVRINAFRYLAEITDPQVRDFALRALRRNPAQAVRDGAIRLLERNGRDEDADAIAVAFPRHGGPDVLHDWVRGVFWAAAPLDDRVPRRTGAAWTALLLRAYEAAPCRECRNSILGVLVERGEAPVALLREALWDAQHQTRSDARRALAALRAARPAKR